MADQLLIDFARELGLPMRGLHMDRHVGWTTDQAKAQTMAGTVFEHVRPVKGPDDEFSWQPYRASPTVMYYRAHGKGDESRQFDGWEIAFPVGAVKVDVAPDAADGLTG